MQTKEEITENYRKNEEKRLRYAEIKEWVYEEEKKNYEKLIIYRQNKTWLAMGGNSALIYACDLATRMGKRREISLKKDTDWKHRFWHGIVAVNEIHLPKLIENLRKIEVELIKKIKDEIYVFKLPRVYSEEILSSYVNLQKMRMDKITSATYVDMSFMETARKSEDLLEYICVVSIGQKRTGKVRMIEKMTDVAVELNMVLVRFSNGKIKMPEFIKEINDILCELIGVMNLVMRTGALELKAVEGVHDRIEKIQKQLALELAKKNG